MNKKSLISCNIDFDMEGKHAGVLNVPISSNESAYGKLPIPITCIKNGEGPTFSFTGGVHGDEYEGPITLMKLARELQTNDITGRVIIIPCLNLPAIQSAERCSPVDGVNLNRAFPGKAHGSLTEMIAHYITTELVPISDFHLDLHSGGKTLEYVPTIFLHQTANPKDQALSEKLAFTFGAEVVVGEDDFSDSGRFLTAMFDLAGKINFTCELSGAGKVNPATVKMAEHGVRNMLKELGVLQGAPISPQMQSRQPSRMANVAHNDCYIMAPDNGLFEPFFDLRDNVKKGQVIGQVHFTNRNDRDPEEVITPYAGFILCNRPPGKVQCGDNIAIIAQYGVT